MARGAKKTSSITIRLDEDVRAGLDKMAEAQDRSLSYLLNLGARRLIESWQPRSAEDAKLALDAAMSTAKSLRTRKR